MTIGINPSPFTYWNITEAICLVQPVANGSCPIGSSVDLLVQGNGPASALLYYAAAGKIWVTQDVQIPAGSSLNDFTSSHHHVTVPEPMSLLLMGPSLIAIGVIRRRKLSA